MIQQYNIDSVDYYSVWVLYVIWIMILLHKSSLVQLSVQAGNQKQRIDSFWSNVCRSGGQYHVDDRWET